MEGYDSGAGELEELLSEALGKFGVAGTISVRGASAWLEGSGPSVSAEVGSLLGQWHTLGPDQKRKRANDLARRLSQDRRAQASASGSGGGFSLPAFVPPVGIVVLAVLAVAGAWTGYRHWMDAQNAANARPIADYDAYERERAERAARVCSATRTRVMRGAAIGPSDVEGWVVELTLLRAPGKPPLADSPELASFFDQSGGAQKLRVRTPKAPVLSAEEGPDTVVAMTEANVPPLGAPEQRGVQFVFSGRYVVPYFTDTERPDFLHLARELSDALAADYGALYARCAAGTSHHLGSWFRGPTPAGTVTSLLYFLGTFSEPADVRASLLVPPGAGSADRAFAFRNVSAAAAGIKKARVVTLVSGEIGALAGADDQVSILTFPFRDSNRASRASHSIARELGIGDGR
jgi:serine/threonine-protein kinase